MKRALLYLLVIGTFDCICSFAQGGTGTVTTTLDFVFPPVGLATGETAAVSLANIAAPAPTPSNGAVPSCTGTVTFANASGTTIGSATAFTVASGKISTVSLPFSSAGITGTRGEILASVQQTTTRPAPATCSLVYSLEVFDSSGETHVFLGNASATTPTPNIIELPR